MPPSRSNRGQARSAALGAIASLALLAPWVHAAAPDPSLAGCWRALKIVLHAPDGAKSEDTTGRCTLQFGDDRFVSACGTSAGRAVTTTYQYRIARPGYYLATMAGSSFGTDLVGSTREYQYRVDGERLFTVSNPQPGPRAAAAGRVELEAARTPCP
jgi:hypothetical protein